MEAEFEAEARDVEMAIAREKAHDKVLSAGKEALGKHRGADRPAQKRGKKNA